MIPFLDELQRLVEEELMRKHIYFDSSIQRDIWIDNRLNEIAHKVYKTLGGGDNQ